MSYLSRAIIEWKEDEQYRPSLSDTEALGAMISHHFRWQGEEIVQTLCEALTDANYHTLVDVIKTEWEKW